MEDKSYIVTPGESGMRLDLALVSLDSQLSRRKIRRIIDIGGAYVNRRRVRIASRIVQTGDKLRLIYSSDLGKKTNSQTVELTLNDIIFEDENILAINKPAGLVSQPTRDQAVHHVLSSLRKIRGDLWQDKSYQLTLVHRLDRETSGVMLIAKNKKFAAWLTKCFKRQEILKEYHAICIGNQPPDSFEVRCYLSSIQPKTGDVKVVRSGGKPSMTGFKLIGGHQKYSLWHMACFPKTGRSHQIRVHLAQRNLPILGDKKYGVEYPRCRIELLNVLSLKRHYLHCYRMSFPAHPRYPHIRIDIEAPYPSEYQEVVESILNQHCGADVKSSK